MNKVFNEVKLESVEHINWKKSNVDFETYLKLKSGYEIYVGGCLCGLWECEDWVDELSKNDYKNYDLFLNFMNCDIESISDYVKTLEMSFNL